MFWRLAITLITLSSSLSTIYAQSQVDHAIIIEVNDFNGEKNMMFYELFRSDPDVKVVNSCDVLGMVVLVPSGQMTMSKQALKSYVDLRLKETMEESEYTLRDDLTPMQVMVDCRSAMQELYEAE